MLMIFLPNGRMQYADIYELQYSLFTELEFGVNRENYLYDQTTNSLIMYNDKYIKVQTSEIPVYAGKTDIMFIPSENFNLVSRLFGYFIQRLESDEDNELKIFASFIDELRSPDGEKLNKQRIIVRTNRGDICSDFFYRTYLAYLHMMFILTNNEVDLSNFDEPLQPKR